MAPLIRTFSFVRKEIVDAVRQPLLLLALIIGPFLILLAFGAGLRENDPPLATVLVVSQESEVREEVERFAAEEGQRERLEIREVADTEQGPLADLRARQLDLVIVFPDEVSDSIENEERAIIELYHNQIDPLEGQAINLFARSAVHEINDRVLETVLETLQDAVTDSREADAVAATDEGEEVERYLELDPAVIVSPFQGEIAMAAGEPVELTDFYAPAVVIVLLQHLAVTLLGLSVVRERSLGTTDLFRVSPLRSSEYLVGKFLAYLALGGVVAAALLALLVFGLGVPMVGEWWQLLVVVAVLLVTSTALGLVLALLANTDSQAVQYAMLVLLATIFLSGFLLSLERFVPLASPLPWLLPATYGIDQIRDVMLRGAPLDWTVLSGLGAYGLVFAIAGAVLVRRDLNASAG